MFGICVVVVCGALSVNLIHEVAIIRPTHTELLSYHINDVTGHTACILPTAQLIVNSYQLIVDRGAVYIALVL